MILVLQYGCFLSWDVSFMLLSLEVVLVIGTREKL